MGVDLALEGRDDAEAVELEVGAEIEGSLGDLGLAVGHVAQQAADDPVEVVDLAGEALAFPLDRVGIPSHLAESGPERLKLGL